jgi:cyanophycinase-like exopeptidase
MAATFHLSASHHSGTRAGQRLLAELAAPLGKSFRACHVGVFHGDDRAFAKVTVEVLRGLGATCESPRLSDRNVDVAAARRAIEGADLLYLDGGDTVAGVERIRELDLVEAFRRAARSARVVYGLSGGACAAGPYTIGYRDSGEAYVAECLDLGVPLPLDVHDEKHDWPELRALLELKPRQREGIAIPTKAVLVVPPRGELSSRGEPLCELRRLARNGRWHVEEIPDGSAGGDIDRERTRA